LAIDLGEDGVLRHGQASLGEAGVQERPHRVLRLAQLDEELWHSWNS
jgi:hypothetical protein